MIAYDAVAAGRTGLPWPDVDIAGPMSLLQTVRTAIGPRPAAGRVDQAWPALPSIAVLLPAPGDVRGLAPGSQFALDALAAGEAVVVSDPDGQTIGVVPAFECDDEDTAPEDGGGDPGVLSWSVYSLPGSPTLDHLDLGEAEYALRSAVRSAADALTSLQLSSGGGDPRSLVEEVLQANQHHRLPDNAPTRAVRVLSTAAHVDAIIMVSSGLTTIGTQSASEARIADAALRPLSAVVRSARSAAVSAILRSAWQS